MRHLVWSIMAIFSALTLGVSPAKAEHSLFSQSCVLGSAEPLSLAEAEQSQNWECNPRGSAAKHSYVWMRIDAAKHSDKQDMVLQSDSMPFAGLNVARVYSDGSYQTTSYSARDIAGHWSAGTNFTVPLYLAGQRPEQIFVRVDKPFDRQVAARLEIVSAERAAAHKMGGIIMLSFFSGMLLLVCVYCGALYVGMRARFALMHAGMVGCFLIYTLSSSSLIFWLIPDLSLVQRTSISYASLALSLAMLMMFVLDFVERDVVPKTVRKSMIASAFILCCSAVSIPVFLESMPFTLRTIYHIAYVPGMLSFLAFTVCAVIRGSKAIRYLCLAWVVPSVVAIERLLRGFNLYQMPITFDFVFYAAMAVETVIMAGAIGWRISHLRRDRDIARKRQQILGQLAETDSLTGLKNRRSFDRRKWRDGDFLALVDIDQFKDVNDTFGHQAGDNVLVALGTELSAQMCGGKIVEAWRIGGEEFVLQMAGNSQELAALELNRIRSRISAAIAAAAPEIAETVTLSAGLSRVGEGGLDEAYKSADRALYHAKAAGRDRLSYEEPGEVMATVFPHKAVA